MSSAAERSTTALMPNEGETVQLEEMSADGSYRKMNVPVSDSNDDEYGKNSHPPQCVI